MTKTTRDLSSKRAGSNEAPQATNIAARRAMSRSWILGLLCGALIFDASAQAQTADPPTANHVFFGCTFTTGTGTGTLNSVLTIPDIALLNNGGGLEASYIIIYVRENPNDGQRIGATQTYTGPVICRNAVTDSIAKTTEGTAILPDPDPDPDIGPPPIDILGAEEASHLQYQESSTVPPNTNPKQKRVCHTVASNTDCFLIRPPSLSLE